MWCRNGILTCKCQRYDLYIGSSLDESIPYRETFSINLAEELIDEMSNALTTVLKTSVLFGCWNWFLKCECISVAFSTIPHSSMKQPIEVLAPTKSESESSLSIHWSRVSFKSEISRPAPPLRKKLGNVWLVNVSTSRRFLIETR